jgi:hypothetical protein
MTKYAPRFWNKETKLYQDLIPFDDNNSGTPGLVPTAEKVREISNTVDSHTNNINTLTKNVGTNTVSISTLQGNVDTNTKDIGALQTSVNTNKNNIDTLQGKVGDVSVTGLKDQVDTNTTNIGALQTSVNKNTGDISTLKTDVSNNATGINELKTSIQNITNGTTAVGLATQLTTPTVPEGQSSPSHYFLGPDGRPLSATASGTISMNLSQDLPQSFKGYSFDVFNEIQPTLNNGVIGLTSTLGKIKIPVADIDTNTKLPTSGLVQSSDDLKFTNGEGTVANLNLSSVTVNGGNTTLQDTLDNTYLKKSGDTGPLNFSGAEASALLTYTDNSNSSKDICSIYPDDNWLVLGNGTDNLHLAGNKLSLASNTPISVTQPIQQTYYRFSQKYQSNTGSDLTNDKIQVSLNSTDNEAYIPMQLQDFSGISDCLSPRSADNASTTSTLTKRGIKVQRTGYYLISGIVRFHTLPSGAEQRIGVELVRGTTDENAKSQMASFNSIGVPSTITVSSITIPPYPVKLEAGEYVGLRASLPHGASGAIGGLNTYGYTSLTFQLIG